MAVFVFLFLSFAFSWAIAGALHLAGGFEGAGAFAALYLVAFMFGPALGAVVAALIFDKGRRLQALSLAPIRWKPVLALTLAGWVLPIGLCALALAASLVWLGQPPADAAARLGAQIEAAGVEIPFDAQTLLMITLAVNLPIGILLNTVILTLSEEIGWRGWLQPRLQGLGFWPMSIVIGVIWGVWHAPIILMGYNYPGLGWAGAGLMIAFTTALNPYFSWIRERSGHVLPAGAMHGSLNAVAGVFLLFSPETAWPHNGLLGLGGLAVLLAGWPIVAGLRRWDAAPA